MSNTNDNGPGSLRQALLDANDGDTIDATSISGVIVLNTGELLVDKSVTINGPGAGLLAIDGNAVTRVFQTGSDKIITISDLTIRNAQGNFGGGILNGDNATLIITASTLSGNTAAFGGGTFNSGTLTILNSTFSGNVAGEGAGIYNSGAGMLTISNSTFSGNTASQTGGATLNLGTLLIMNSTVSDNSGAFLAGGILNFNNLAIENTVLKTGESGENIYSNSQGTVASLGYNISNDEGGEILTGPGDQIFTDPLLGPLQNNGGPTFTHELLPGSPAINAGNPAFTPPPLFDQRGPGFARVVNGRIDIGSFEVQDAAITPTPSPTGTPLPTATPRPSSTPTATATATSTPRPTPTPVATPSPTAIPTATPTPTTTPRQSPTPRARPTPRPRVVPRPRPTPPRATGSSSFVV